MAFFDVLCLGGVIAASFLDVWSAERASRRAVAWPRESHVRCPYCHESLAPASDGIVACVACESIHHADCFRDHGGCSVYGCRRRRTSLPVAAPPGPDGQATSG